MELKLDAIVILKKEVPDRCSLICLKGKKKLMMENAKRNSWPPPWLGGVIRGWKLQPVPWLGSKLYWEVVSLMPPWPPPVRVSFLTWESSDIGVLVIGIVILRHELAELKPWSPPSLVSSWARVHFCIGALILQRVVLSNEMAELEPWPPPQEASFRFMPFQGTQKCWNPYIALHVSFTLLGRKEVHLAICGAKSLSFWLTCADSWGLINNCYQIEVERTTSLSLSTHNNPRGITT